MVMDEQYFVLQQQKKVVIFPLLSKPSSPCYSKTKVIVIDKDFPELSILQDQKLQCQIHIIKHLYIVASDVDVPWLEESLTWHCLPPKFGKVR